MLPGHTRLRDQITEVLDLDLIKQEAENGALDIAKLAEFIIGMMGTLCAPARDEEVKKLKDIKEIVPLFRYGMCPSQYTWLKPACRDSVISKMFLKQTTKTQKCRNSATHSHCFSRD